MKKLFLLTAIIFLAGCVKTGDFGPEREALHEKRNYDVCNDNPSRCVNGTIPW